MNDAELPALCEYFRARGHTLRFIEFMDVGNTNHWTRDRVVPAREIVAGHPDAEECARMLVAVLRDAAGR